MTCKAEDVPLEGRFVGESPLFPRVSVLPRSSRGELLGDVFGELLGEDFGEARGEVFGTGSTTLFVFLLSMERTRLASQSSVSGSLNFLSLSFSTSALASQQTLSTVNS